MKLDAIRFSIGPWNGRYSSVWRIWSNPGSDDVYLGVSTLLRYLKISLHKTGRFRAAFVDTYNQKLVDEGKDIAIDRAFLKWEKLDFSEETIMQALDIHFPLSALSSDRKPAERKGKKIFLITPHESFVRDNDTITVKILFHKLSPDDKKLRIAFGKRGLIAPYYAELANDEYITIAFGASKQLPITLSKEEQQRYAHMCEKIFRQSAKKVGDRIDDLTIQTFQMAKPPSIFNIGRMSIVWDSEKHFIISIGQE